MFPGRETGVIITGLPQPVLGRDIDLGPTDLLSNMDHVHVNGYNLRTFEV